MTPPQFRLGVLAAAIAMTGCASLPGGPTGAAPAGARGAVQAPAAGVPAPRIVPHEAVRHGIASADAFYATGKQRLSNGDLRGALAAFDEALALDASHLDARNGRASTLANLGERARAIEELQAAATAHPGAAHLHNNLGYLLMGEGRLEEAAGALRRALAADPSHVRANANWAQLVRRAPAGARWATPATAGAASNAAAPARAPEIVAGAVVELAWPAPAAGPSRTAPSGAEPSRAAAPAEPVAGVRAAVSPAVSPAVAQAASARPPLRPSAVRSAAAAASVSGPAPTAFASAAPVRAASAATAPSAIEVANGAGVGGLARRTALALRAAGQPVARIGNHSDFRQATTTVRYREGRRDEAVALAARLGLPESAALRADDLPGGIDARVVLGRDAAAGLALDRPLRADYLEPLREQAAALQALLDASVV